MSQSGVAFAFALSKNHIFDDSTFADKDKQGARSGNCGVEQTAVLKLRRTGADRNNYCGEFAALTLVDCNGIGMLQLTDLVKSIGCGAVVKAYRQLTAEAVNFFYDSDIAVENTLTFLTGSGFPLNIVIVFICITLSPSRKIMPEALYSRRSRWEGLSLC